MERNIDQNHIEVADLAAAHHMDYRNILIRLVALVAADIAAADIADIDPVDIEAHIYLKDLGKKADY